MPFKSEKQRRFMFARHPEIAKRWMQEGKAYVEGKSPGQSVVRNAKRVHSAPKQGVALPAHVARPIGRGNPPARGK